ncbi:PIN-like domain-containing protein [Acinetobacter baumannii]|uniref:PIN-like domain-containing protein n=1 Tax=Acinetobacter baumannii TaxID=470 RepID=UPI00338D4FB7
MKNIFTSFYENHEEDYLKSIWKSPNTRFILDTNVLLSLYSFQKDSRNDFINILKKINSRIWIPHHVALEFQRNRLKVIKNHRIHFQNMQKETEDFLNSISFDDQIFVSFKNKFSTKSKHPSINENIDNIIKNLTSEFNNLKKLLEQEIEDLKQLIAEIDQDKIYLNSKDYIRDELDLIFSSKSLGNNIFENQDSVDKFIKEGEYRYKNLIPPGYKDAINKENDVFTFNGLTYKSKFGDLLIFKQIIEFAKDPKIKNIIFISEDVKEDWRIIENLNGKKILGARPELKQEIFKEASVENFYIFDINDFLKHTNNSLNLRLNPDSVADIKNALLFSDFNENFNDFMEKFNETIKFQNEINTPTQREIKERSPMGYIYDTELYSKIKNINQKLNSINDSKLVYLELINVPPAAFFFSNYEKILDIVDNLEIEMKNIDLTLTASDLHARCSFISQQINNLNMLIKLDPPNR